MGYLRVEFHVVARLSSHNSPRDDEHDELWEELTTRLSAVVDDPKYVDILPMVTGCSER